MHCPFLGRLSISSGKKTQPQISFSSLMPTALILYSLQITNDSYWIPQEKPVSLRFPTSSPHLGFFLPLTNQTSLFRNNFNLQLSTKPLCFSNIFLVIQSCQTTFFSWNLKVKEKRLILNILYSPLIKCKSNKIHDVKFRIAIFKKTEPRF